MSKYKSLPAKKCAKMLLKIKKPLVLMHARPDGDTVGAGIALCEIFKALGREPKYISEDKIPKRLEFLTEGNTLATEADFKGAEVIAVDIATPSQAGLMFYKLPAPVMMIDHHDVGEPFADGYVVKGLSSAGEAVMDIAEELVKLGRIKLTTDIAYPLYAAMSSDTACFRYSSSNKLTYEKAGRLISTGIDFSDINHRLFNSKLPEQVRAEGFVSARIKTAMDGKLAYATVAKREREMLNIDFEFFETAVDIVRSIAGVKVAFVVKETDAGEYRASLRSTGANVAKIAEILGGGGHIRAAGCTPKAKDIDEAAKIVVELIKREQIIK